MPGWIPLALPLTLLAPESPADLHGSATRAVAVLRSIEGLDLRSARPPTTDAPRVAEIRAALDRSREAFRNLDLDASIREATSVVDRFPSADASPGEDARLLREALARIAQAHMAAGRNLDGQGALARAAGIGLPEPLPLTEFPPPIVDAYEREKRRLLSSPRTRLALEVEPSDADILVDGLPPLRAGAGEIEVLPTEHVLVATYGGRRSVVRRIGEEDRAVRIEIPPPDQAVGEVRMELVRSGPDAVVVRVLARLSADDPVEVFEEEASLDRVEVVARRVAIRLRDRVAPQPVAAPAAATASPDPQSGPEVPAGPAPFYDRWWFWTAVGVGIVAGVAAASQALGEPDSDVYITSP